MTEYRSWYDAVNAHRDEITRRNDARLARNQRTDDAEPGTVEPIPLGGPRARGGRDGP
jgi:hypothetical protein